MNPELNAFYKTKRWQKTRAAYLASIGGLCERCAKRGLIVPATVVHHKHPLTEELINDPHIAYSFESLEGLCRSCHEIEHHRMNGRYELETE